MNSRETNIFFPRGATTTANALSIRKMKWLKKAEKLISPIYVDILTAHETRDSIVYNPDFKLSVEQAKKILDTYESAINSIGAA